MSTYVDIKYLNLMSHRLPKFTKKGDYLWNFRCPFCGDSKKSQSKARGYVYRTKNDLFYKCHNCSKGTNLANLILEVEESLYSQYLVERYKEGTTANGRGQNVENPKFNIPKPIFIDKDIFSEFKSLENDHPRMVIPFRDKNKKIFAYQGRAFGKETPKYITIVLDQKYKKIFGIDRLDNDRSVIICEGPLDSLFLPNCIAVAQSDLRLHQYKDKGTLVPDNEPRNEEIVKNIERAIDDGYKVVIWPSHIKEKDINDMILSGSTSKEILDTINHNTFSGLTAKTKLTNWRRRDV